MKIYEPMGAILVHDTMEMKVLHLISPTVRIYSWLDTFTEQGKRFTHWSSSHLSLPKH